MIAIVNYGLGNLTSIQNMFSRLGISSVVTSDFEVIQGADKLILPGVGHYRQGMENLESSRLRVLLDELVIKKAKPILGICLGAQLMTNYSEEGGVKGLGWIDAATVKFKSSELNNLKVPHMGWAEIAIRDESVLWKDLPVNPRFYHVHSYHFLFDELSKVSATTKYGYEFACAFKRGNIYGTQFHPEKSHKYGMKVLENFANYAD